VDTAPFLPQIITANSTIIPFIVWSLPVTCSHC